MKLTLLAVKYAKAHRDLRLATRVYQDACDDMSWPIYKGNERERKFFSDDFGKWRYEDADLCPIELHGNVVEGAADLAIIARWKEAYDAKVAAARKLGALRGAFLKHGKRLIKEGAK